MRKIGGLLGRSPFGPVHEHMLKVVSCLELVVPLVNAACDGDQSAVRDKAAGIKHLELEADSIKSAIRAQFSTSLLAAVARSEVLALVKAQDDVADQCERLSYELSLRNTRFAPFICGDARSLAGALATAAPLLSSIARMLDESGGRLDSEASKELSSLLSKLESSAAAAEPLADAVLHDLFSHESEVPVIDIIFLLRFAESAQKVSGKIQNVADVLARLISELTR